MNDVNENRQINLFMGNRVKFQYTNYKGEKAARDVECFGVFFGTMTHHTEPQWLLYGFDRDRQETRHFALSKIEPIS